MTRRKKILLAVVAVLVAITIIQVILVNVGRSGGSKANSHAGGGGISTIQSGITTTK